MDQQLRPEESHLTPEEAEEVLRRFREEEEEIQRRMEARATNPTVADLAEGLGVPAERIARLLNDIRERPSPLARVANKEASQEAMQSDHKTAWIVAIIVFGVLFLAIIAAIFYSTFQPPDPPAPPAPISTNNPASDAVAPVAE